MLLANLVKQGTLVHDCDKRGEIWHKRFCHIHYGVIVLLNDMMQGLPNFKTRKPRACKVCALGKQAKIDFPNSDHRSRYILYMIHSNASGPMSSTYLICNLYYVSFINDSFKNT